MKHKGVWFTAITSVVIICLTAAAYVGFRNAEENSNRIQVLEAVYMQCEKAVKSHISFIEIVEDVIKYERACTENPTWENIRNFRVAAACAQTALSQVPTNTLILTEEQLNNGRKLGFDFSSFLHFCDAELDANFKSNYTLVSGRFMISENFVIESEYENLKRLADIDEKNLQYSKEYLLLELQNFWSDFPEIDARKRLIDAFPDFDILKRSWETDKALISKYESTIAEQIRVLGNDEGTLELEKKQGLKAKIIKGLPTMVPEPFFSENSKKSTVYMTKDNKKITTIDICRAVSKAQKCKIVYENVSYEEYTDYLTRMNFFDFKVKDVYYADGRISETVYIADKTDYIVKYEDNGVTLKIDSIDDMVLVPNWYIMEVSPELFEAKHTEKPTEKDNVSYELTEQYSRFIKSAWDSALGYFNRKIIAAEKILKYQKAYIDNPNAENLLNFQFMAHLGMKELMRGKSEIERADTELKMSLISADAYERAEKNLEFTDLLLDFSVAGRKSLFDDYIWYNAYYKNTAGLFEREYENESAALKECKTYLTLTVYLASRNLGENQRRELLDYLYKTYQHVFADIPISFDTQSDNFKIQALSDINYLYDELSKSTANAELLMEQHKNFLGDLKKRLAGLGTDMDAFIAPNGTDADKTIPWVFSFNDAECIYTISEEAAQKSYADLLPEDITAYSIVYPNKTYEDALTGISRLEEKDISVSTEIYDEENQFFRGTIDQNGKTIIYEWNRDKVTMSFPDRDTAIVPYGWYHYFG